MTDKIELLRNAVEKNLIELLRNAEAKNKNAVLFKLALAAADAKYGGRLPRVVVKRLEEELEIVISRKCHAEGFLVVREFISAALDAGLMVAPYAQTGSSALLYFLGITGVNPLAPHYYCASPFCRRFKTVSVPGGGALCGHDLAAEKCPKCFAPLEKDGFDIPFETLLMPESSGRFCLMFSAEPAAFKMLTEKAVEKFRETRRAVETGRDSFDEECETTIIHFDKIFKLNNDRFRFVIINAEDSLKNPGPAVIAARLKTLSWPVLNKPDGPVRLGEGMIESGKRRLAVSENSSCRGTSKFNFVFRDDIFNYMIKKGIDRVAAFLVSETVRKGKWATASPEVKSDLKKYGCSPEALEEFGAIEYMPSKASGAMEAILSSYGHC